MNTHSLEQHGDALPKTQKPSHLFMLLSQYRDSCASRMILKCIQKGATVTHFFVGGKWS